MTIKEDFINKEENLNRRNTIAEEALPALKIKVAHLKNILKGDKNIQLALTAKDLERIIYAYRINENSLEGRAFIKEVINSTNYNARKDFPVVFQYNLLILNKEMIEEFITRDLDNQSSRELIQTLTLIKLHNKVSLEEATTINNLSFDYTQSFEHCLSLEHSISHKISNCCNFHDLANSLGPLSKDFHVKNQYLTEFEETVREIQEIVLKEPNNDSLIEFYDNKICFNYHSLAQYSDNLNDDMKRELIQAFALMTQKSAKDAMDYSQNFASQKEKVLSLVKRRVTNNEIIDALSKIPRDLANFDFDTIKKELQVSYKNSFLIFEDSEINSYNLDKILSDDFKSEQIHLYFIIQCCKEDSDFYCLLKNNKKIEFKAFEDYFYLEPLLEKQLSQYSLTDILKVIHEFKKDKIFDKEQNTIIDHILAETFISKFSFNVKNKDLIFINSESCVFNEKLISNLNTLSNEQLLEAFLLTNETLKSQLKENITLDKRVDNLNNYKDKIINKIKYVIDENDIASALENIEIKSNTLITSKSPIFHQASISLNAKESSQITNDVVVFVYNDKKEMSVLSFDEEICEKLLKKEISKTTKREFIQALFLYEAQQRNVSLINKNDNTIKIHDNFNEVKNHYSSMQEKVFGQIQEEDLNDSLNIIMNRLNESTIGTLESSVNAVKRKLGLRDHTHIRQRL